MRLAHHLLRHPTGLWHFRLTVPRDLHAALGLQVIKKSLGTFVEFARRFEERVEAKESRRRQPRRPRAS